MQSPFPQKGGDPAESSTYFFFVLGKLLNLSGPRFVHLRNEGVGSVHLRGLL